MKINCLSDCTISFNSYQSFRKKVSDKGIPTKSSALEWIVPIFLKTYSSGLGHLASLDKDDVCSWNRSLQDKSQVFDQSWFLGKPVYNDPFSFAIRFWWGDFDLGSQFNILHFNINASCGLSPSLLGSWETQQTHCGRTGSWIISFALVVFLTHERIKYDHFWSSKVNAGFFSTLLLQSILMNGCSTSWTNIFWHQSNTFEVHFPCLLFDRMEVLNCFYDASYPNSLSFSMWCNQKYHWRYITGFVKFPEQTHFLRLVFLPWRVCFLACSVSTSPSR